jgi:hypothetical protein
VIARSIPAETNLHEDAQAGGEQHAPYAVVDGIWTDTWLLLIV